jgi:hypothetical protein
MWSLDTRESSSRGSKSILPASTQHPVTAAKTGASPRRWPRHRYGRTFCGPGHRPWLARTSSGSFVTPVRQRSDLTSATPTPSTDRVRASVRPGRRCSSHGVGATCARPCGYALLEPISEACCCCHAVSGERVHVLNAKPAKPAKPAEKKDGFAKNRYATGHYWHDWQRYGRAAPRSSTHCSNQRERARVSRCAGIDARGGPAAIGLRRHLLRFGMGLWFDNVIAPLARGAFVVAAWASNVESAGSGRRSTISRVVGPPQISHVVGRMGSPMSHRSASGNPARCSGGNAHQM